MQRLQGAGVIVRQKVHPRDRYPWCVFLSQNLDNKEVFMLQIVDRLARKWLAWRVDF